MRKIFAGSALAFTAVSACSDERAITTEPIAVGYGQNLIKAATNLPRGRVNFTATRTAAAPASAAGDTIVINFAGLDSLTAGSYQFWVANDSATKFAKLVGTLTVSQVDTTISETGDPVFTPSTHTFNNVSDFKNGGPNKRFRFIARRDAMVGDFAAGDSIGTLIMSIETAAPGTEPSNIRPIWARRSEAGTSGATLHIAGLKFGNFAPRKINEFVYDSSTTALVPTATTKNVPRGRVEVRGDVFTVNDSNYYRPPQGYYYKAWAIKVGEFGVFVDTISLGDKASPYPRRISFKEADVSIPDPISMFVSGTPCVPTATECPTQQPVIWASQHRVLASEVGAVVDGRPWKNVAWTYVTLESKFNPDDVMGGVVVMSNNLPGSISGL